MDRSGATLTSEYNSLIEAGDSAQSVQMWCLLQVLAGKLFETWNMLSERFFKAKPDDPTLEKLNDKHKASLSITHKSGSYGCAQLDIHET